MPDNMTSNITQQAKNSSDSSVIALKQTPIKAEEANGAEEEVAHVFIIIMPTDASFHPTPHSVNNDADEAANNQR